MKKLFILTSAVTSYLFLALPVYAQTKLDETGCVQDGVATLDCVKYIVGNLIFWLLLFAGIVALILVIISGFKFVTSGGDPKQAEGARKTLTYAIIGLVVILLSFAIVRFISETTGVGCITDFGFEQCNDG